MEPILNSQLPEFSVRAFHNGAFKTVTNNDRKVNGRFFSSILPTLLSYVLLNWWIWLKSTISSRRWV